MPHMLAIDIAGAFDKVSHSGLQHKASISSFDGGLLGWLTSYLSQHALHAVVGSQSYSQSIQGYPKDPSLALPCSCTIKVG